MLVPGWNGMPGGVSEAISVKPDGVSSWLCMTLSSKPGRRLAEVAERVDRQLAAEDVLVGLHRLARAAVEGDVGVQSRGHGRRSFRLEGRPDPMPRPTPTTARARGRPRTRRRSCTGSPCETITCSNGSSSSSRMRRQDPLLVPRRPPHAQDAVRRGHAVGEHERALLGQVDRRLLHAAAVVAARAGRRAARGPGAPPRARSPARRRARTATARARGTRTSARTGRRRARGRA